MNEKDDNYVSFLNKCLEDRNKTIEAKEERINKLEDYARHGKNSDGVMCEKSKHSDFDCTCGLEKVLNYEEK